MPKSDLVQYVARVNALIQDHDKQTQELSDIRALADIVNETWQTRLDLLADYILDLNPKNKQLRTGTYEGLPDNERAKCLNTDYGAIQPSAKAYGHRPLRCMARPVTIAVT